MQDKIDYIMDRFKFKIVGLVMKFMNWKWCSDNGREIPDVMQIEDSARDLLERVSKEEGEYYISTGDLLPAKLKMAIWLLVLQLKKW